MITLDANIFVYASDDRDPLKQAIAQIAIRATTEMRSVVSLQTIGETQNAMTRKLKRPPTLAAEIARDILITYDLVAPTAADVDVALTWMMSGRLSYWDGLLLSTTARAGCTAILTEDMQDGATLLDVEIVNPFGPDGLSSRAAELLAA